jgi:hypothetical protein
LSAPFGGVFGQFNRPSPGVNDQANAAAMNGYFSIAARASANIKATQRLQR